MKANSLKEELKTQCELYWWNCGKKTLSFKGELKDLLKINKITFTKKLDRGSLYTYHFKNPYNISFKVRGTIQDFPHCAKQFMQMELVRMGDKAQLTVGRSWRPKVTVNF